MPAGYISLDQAAWHEEARSIILRGRFDIEEPVGRAGTWAYVFNDRDGRYYSKFGSINGLLSVPPLAVELALSGELPHDGEIDMKRPAVPPLRVILFNLEFISLSVLCAVLIWASSSYYSASLWTRVLFVLMALYCTTLLHYLRFPSSELTQVVLFLLFWHFVLRFGRRQERLAERRVAMFIGHGSRYSCFVKLCVADLFILPLFGLFLAWGARTSGSPLRWQLKFALAKIVLPGTLIVAAQGVVHFLKFGNPFLSGYHQYWEPPNPHTVWQVLLEFTVHPQWSAFLTFPVLILAARVVAIFASAHSRSGISAFGLLRHVFDRRATSILARRVSLRATVFPVSPSGPVAASTLRSRLAGGTSCGAALSL